MQIIGVKVENSALDSLKQPAFSNWMQYGPGAGRSAVSLAVDQSDAVRALNYLATSTAYQPATMSRLANHLLPDRFFDPEANGAVELLKSTFHVPPPPWGGATPPASPLFLQPPYLDRMLSAPASDLRQILPDEAFNPLVTPHTASKLSNDLFAVGGGFGQDRFVTLSKQAEHVRPVEKQLVPAPVTSETFDAAAKVLGSGMAGVLAGGLASAIGAPALLSIGIGGVIASGALWLLSGTLQHVDLTRVWNLFSSTVGTVVGGVLHFGPEGSALPNGALGMIGPLPSHPATPTPSNMLSRLVTLDNSEVARSLYAVAWR